MEQVIMKNSEVSLPHEITEKFDGFKKKSIDGKGVMSLESIYEPMQQYWTDKDQVGAYGAFLSYFLSGNESDGVRTYCSDIMFFSPDLTKTLNSAIEYLNSEDNSRENTIQSFSAIMMSLSFRLKSLESMFEKKEISEQEYTHLIEETKTAFDYLILKTKDEIVVDFLENSDETSGKIKEAMTDGILQGIFSTEIRFQNPAIETAIIKYLKLKPENKEKLFDRRFFNFQGENLLGFLITGGFYDFIAANISGYDVVSFLTTRDAELRMYHEVEQDPTKREKTRFEQSSLKDTTRKVDMPERINSSVLTHAIANFLEIAAKNPDSPEKDQAALLVVDLFDKLNKHIEKLSQEPNEAKRRKGFEEINYILNDVIKIGGNYTTVADFLESFEINGEVQNNILEKSWQILGCGKNLSPYGIKLHTLKEMYDVVRSNPEKFNPYTIRQIFTKPDLSEIKNAEGSSERISVLQRYIRKENRRIIIDEGGLEFLLASVQDNPELNQKLERDIWTVIAKSYADINLPGHHVMAMQKWLTSEHYRLAGVFLEYERSGMDTLLGIKTPNPRIFTNLAVSRENFPTTYKYLFSKTDQQAKIGSPYITVGSPYVINELTRKRGLFGLGKRLCDQKMPAREVEATKRVLTEAEFDDIKIYEILLNNAKSNSDRVGVLKRALKLSQFNSSAVCSKFLKNVILDKNISNENKKDLLNAAEKETIIGLLKSLSDKELINLLNNAEVSRDILSKPEVSEYIIKERLAKKIGFIFKTTVLKSLNMTARGILSKGEHEPEQRIQRPEQQDLQPHQELFVVSIDGNSKPKKTKEELEEFLGGNTKFIPPMINFLERCPDFDNQALLLARRAKLTETQAYTLYEAIKDREDIRKACLSAILMNPEMNKQKPILDFVINATRETQDAELWKQAVKYVSKTPKIEPMQVPRNLTAILVGAN